MEHIGDNLKSSKYSSIYSKSQELARIKEDIIKTTGFEPKSVMIKNNFLIIKANNDYEAVELRMCIGTLSRNSKYIIKIIS